MIENIKTDILKIYNYMYDHNKIKKLGYPDHNLFQLYLKQLANKYKLTCKTEYFTKFYDKEKERYYKGRIDLAYYKNNKPYLILEIDCGLKSTSIKKLLANKEFKYKIWFCYNKNINTEKYYNLINKLDINKEIIYLTTNRFN